MNMINSAEIRDIKIRFLNFINNFTFSNGLKPYRFDKVFKKFVRKNIILNINISHIAEFDIQLYLKITGYPSELIRTQITPCKKMQWRYKSSGELR